MRNFGARKAKGGQNRVKITVKCCKASRILPERHEDEAVENMGGNGAQAQFRAVNFRRQVARVKQAAVKIIGPSVIGAGKALGIAARLYTHPLTAVAAHICQAMDLAQVIAVDDHGFLQHFE